MDVRHTEDLIGFAKAESQLILVHQLAVLLGTFGPHVDVVLELSMRRVDQKGTFLPGGVGLIRIALTDIETTCEEEIREGILFIKYRQSYVSNSRQRQPVLYHAHHPSHASRSVSSRCRSTRSVQLQASRALTSVTCGPSSD